MAAVLLTVNDFQLENIRDEDGLSRTCPLCHIEDIIYEFHLGDPSVSEEEWVHFLVTEGIHCPDCGGQQIDLRP